MQLPINTLLRLGQAATVAATIVASSGMLETVGLSWTLADEYVRRVQAVTAAQVQEVARKYFIDDRLTVAVLEPQPISSDTSINRSDEGHGHVR